MIHTTVKRQRTEEELALLGKGDLSLDPLYQEIAVKETVFYRKSEQQKVALLKKFKNQQVKSQDVISSFSDITDCTTSNLHSVSAQQSGIIRVPFEVLSQIFQKACVLLSRAKDAIIAAPGANAYPQHYVESEKAVAELDGNTETFLSWYKVHKQGAANISALSQIDLPSGRGTKRTRSTQIRKGGKNTNKKSKTVVEDYMETRSDTSTRTSTSTCNSTRPSISTSTSTRPSTSSRTSTTPSISTSTRPRPSISTSIMPSASTSTMPSGGSTTISSASTTPLSHLGSTSAALTDSQMEMQLQGLSSAGPQNALSQPKMQEGAYQVGLLQFCFPLVRKCYGCGQMLKSRNGSDNNLQIPRPPNDMVIISATRRPYWQNGVQKRGNLANVYYHCKVSCVKMMQPAFIPFLVVIPPVLRPYLLPEHRRHILDELQIV
ncbi:uncharacterized protein LOC144652410 [Oculina patagonica]